MTKGEHGEHVTALQEALEALGYDLPRFGADGWMGDETLDGCLAFALDHGMDAALVGNNHVSDELVQLILASAAVAPPLAVAPGLPTDVHDFRVQHIDKMGGQRDWSEVTGITLHQTATCFLMAESNPDPDKLKRALSRVAKIKAHAVVLRCGHTALNAPITRRMAQAQRYFNKTDFGIEIDGWYGGVHDNPRTFWKPKSRPDRTPMELSQVQVAATRALCRWVVETVAHHGGEVRHVHAHRQTHSGKPSDPGQLLWQAVGVWCRDTLGLTYEVAGGETVPAKNSRRGDCWSTRGPGRPIPYEWDARQPHKYSDKG